MDSLGEELPERQAGSSLPSPLTLPLCNPMDYTIHGIFQARILERVAFPFLQRIFPTQELNRGHLHFRRILYQLSYQGNPYVASETPEKAP